MACGVPISRQMLGQGRSKLLEGQGGLQAGMWMGAMYYGTKGHTMQNRCIAHQEALTKGDNSYAITRHKEEKRQDCDLSQGQLFVMELVDQRASNLERYIAEGCAIETAKKTGESLLNQRGEWGRAKLGRLALTSNLDG